MENFVKTRSDANALRFADFGEMKTADLKRSNREVKSTKDSSARFVFLCVRLGDSDEIKVEKAISINVFCLIVCLFN